MWIAAEPAQPASEDLTTRARIRDAALVQFAEHGVKGATIRGIAETAGVSPGNVTHHFKSKEELRAACDAYALDFTRHTKEEALFNGEFGKPGFTIAALRMSVPVVRYLARALVDGSPAAAKLFDELVAYTGQFVQRMGGGDSVSRTSEDDLAFAAVLTAMHLGVIMLHEQVSRILGKEIFTPQGHPPVGRAMLEIYSRNLLPPELAAAALSRYQSFTASPGQPGPTSIPTQEQDHHG